MLISVFQGLIFYTAYQSQTLNNKINSALKKKADEEAVRLPLQHLSKQQTNTNKQI